MTTGESFEAAKFGCRCGAVRGRVAPAGPRAVNRVVCYCDDCQAFAHWLGRADLLDAHGGSDIVQFAPGSMAFTQGEDHVAGMRLTDRGLYRFHTTCCRTPLGNTVGPRIPFVGVDADVFRVDGQDPDAVFGKPTGGILARHAVGKPEGAAQGIPPGLMLRAVLKVLSWRLAGRAWPHPFFERATGRPKFTVTALPAAERDRLRPLCGPRD